MQAVQERDRENYDWWLLGITILLLGLGMVIVLDASGARAFQSAAYKNDPFYFFKRHLIWAVASAISLAVGMNFPHWKLRRWWLPGITASLIMLVLVLIPHIGKEVNGARRWLGFGQVQFQPSEFAKIALIVFLARYSELWRGRVQHLTKGFIPAVLVVLGTGALVAKEDLGTSIVIVSTGLLMIFMMGAQPRHMAGLMAVVLAGGLLFTLKASTGSGKKGDDERAAVAAAAEKPDAGKPEAGKKENFRMQRIKAWLDLIRDPLGKDTKHDGRAYQPAQGLMALASGGVFGHGIGHGGAKHLYLPAEHTDYILATVGEETGLVGCLFLLLLFAKLIVQGLTVAHRSRDWFGSMLAAGLTAMIGIQALLNIGVVTAILPCTGVPLPFISYGGSSLVFTTLAMGIVLNVSRYPNRVRPERSERPDGGVRDGRESFADGRRNGRAHLSGA